MTSSSDTPSPSRLDGVAGLVTVVDRLLDPEGGCVWNRGQTHRSLATYAVEESYELVDAIDSGDVDDLREELGDVLYQVVLHAGIAARAGQFDLDDVAAGVRDKMVRRHPHVFGDERADTVEDVVRVWRAAKAAEKASRTSVFDGVPRAMPPLERAVKLSERIDERDGDGGAVAAARSLQAATASTNGVLTAGASTDGASTDGASTAGAPTAGAPTAGAPTDGTPPEGVDLAWGADVLVRVAAARVAGIDPVASLRAAVADLERVARAAAG